MSDFIVINNWDTFLEWKTKNNDLSAAVGDTAKITVDLNSTIVEELIKLQGQSYDENRILDIVGRMIARSTDTGIDITYNEVSNHLTFTVTGGGSGGSGSADGFSGIFDSVEGIESLYDFWRNQPGNSDDTSIDAFFESIVVGPTGTEGINGVRGMDADAGTYRMSLEVYNRTPDGVPPAVIADTNNGSSFDILGSGSTAFIPPTGWSTTTPLALSSDPAVSVDEKLWVSTTIIETLSAHNSSKVYQLDDRVLFNGNTYRYKLDYSTTDFYLTLNRNTDAAVISPLYAHPVGHDQYIDAIIYYIVNGFPDVTGYKIPANAYNFIELAVDESTGLNINTWELVVDATGTNIGTKLVDIPNWSAPIPQNLAGDGADGRSGSTIHVYTLDESAIIPPTAPEGGHYSFTGQGTLEAPVDLSPENRVWVENFADATLPGGTLTYSEDRTQGVLWYTSVTFLGESPVDTVYHTDDGEPYVSGQNTRLSWGMVLRSGTDGENATEIQQLRLYKRLTDNEAATEIHPINGTGVTPLPVQWNFINDQLELSYTVGGTVWHRWPENNKDLVRLVTPAEMLGSNEFGATFYPDFDASTGMGFPAADRLGGILPNADYAIASNDDRKITQALIDAGGEFSGIDPQYIGYYLGSPKDIIDNTRQWVSRLISSATAKTNDHNLYVIESMASGIIGGSGVDTTLAWFPDNIPEAKHTSNGYNGVDGVEGQSITEVAIWNRTVAGANPLTSLDLASGTTALYEFSFINNSGYTENSGVIHNMPTDWELSSFNNQNGYGCAVGNPNCWSEGDPHFKAVANAVYPKTWNPSISYAVDSYVIYYNKTYKCLIATVYDGDNRAVEVEDAPVHNITGATPIWEEITVDSKSGVFSTTITGWTVSTEEVGNQGPAGDAGSKIYTGSNAPVIDDTGEIYSDLTHIYEFTSPASLININARRGDQYIDSLNGEIWEFHEDPSDTTLTVAVSLWEMDITGKEHDWIYRTWHYPVGNMTMVAQSNTTFSMEVADAELAIARQLHQTKDIAAPFPLPVINNSVSPVHNITVSHLDEWTSEFPVYTPETYKILGVKLTYHRGTSRPGGPIAGLTAWDVSTAYNINKAVEYSGLSYIALIAHTGTTPGTDATIWSEIGNNHMTWSNSIDLTGATEADDHSPRWFFGEMNPMTEFNTYGICEAEGLNQPVACTAANTDLRLDRNVGSLFIRTADTEESAFKLIKNSSDELEWEVTLPNLRGQDGDQTMTLYWSEAQSADEAPPAKLANVVDGDGSPSPKLVETNNSAGDYYDGWQKDPLLPATAEGYYTYSITAYKDAGDISHFNGPGTVGTGTWLFSEVATTGTSVWHVSHEDNPNGHTFTRPVTDGDFYVQKASNGVTETIWTYQRDTQLWEVLVQEMAGTVWYDGNGTPDSVFPPATNPKGKLGDAYLDYSDSEAMWKKELEFGNVGDNVVWVNKGRQLQGEEGPKVNFIFASAGVNATSVTPPATHTYNWNDTGQLGSTIWYDSPPSVQEGFKIWASLGKTATGTSDLIISWTTPTPLTGDVGQQGPGGSSSLILHKISASTPSIPTNYQIGDSLPTNSSSGSADWTNNPGTVAAGQYDWMITGKTPDMTITPNAPDPTLYTFGAPIKVSGADGLPGVGQDGIQQASGYLFYGTNQTYTPSLTTTSGYQWTGSNAGKFTQLSSGWSHDIPIQTPDANGNSNYWSCWYSVSLTPPSTNSVVQRGTVRKTTNFTGLVTFTNASSGGLASSGDWDNDVSAATSGMLTTSTNLANQINANVTLIDGGKITTNSLSLNHLTSSGSAFTDANANIFSLSTSAAAQIMGGGYSGIVHVVSEHNLTAGLWSRNNDGGYPLGAALFNSGNGSGAAGYFVSSVNTLQTGRTTQTQLCSDTYGVKVERSMSGSVVSTSHMGNTSGGFDTQNVQYNGWSSGNVHTSQLNHDGTGSYPSKIGFLSQIQCGSSSSRTKAHAEHVGLYLSGSDGSSFPLTAGSWHGIRTGGGNILTQNGDIDTGTGAVNPFTGSHLSVINKSESIEIGDILIDQLVIGITQVSESLTQVVLSSASNQKATIGIFNGKIITSIDALNRRGPSALIENHPYTEEELANHYAQQAAAASTNGEYVSTPPLSRNKLKDEFADIMDTNDIIQINAVGEGAVNVCGENGDFEAGDLIVTSSTPGKGMKQDDDIIRSYTVAKVREAVTFSDATEVKLVACIYLCG